MKRGRERDSAELNYNRLIHRQPPVVTTTQSRQRAASGKKKSAGGKTKDFSRSLFFFFLFRKAVRKYVNPVIERDFFLLTPPLPSLPSIPPTRAAFSYTRFAYFSTHRLPPASSPSCAQTRTLLPASAASLLLSAIVITAIFNTTIVVTHCYTVINQLSSRRRARPA